MGQDSNRGRDLPLAKQKRVKLVVDPEREARNAIVARAKKIDRSKKKLAKITSAHGFDTLFAAAAVMSDKAKMAEKKFVIECLVLGLPVHSQLEAFHGLTAQQNPKTSPINTDEAPF